MGDEAAAPGEGSSPPSVLLVAAEERTVDAVSTRLNEAGFLVSVAPDGEAALERLDAETFDCLVVSTTDGSVDRSAFVAGLRSAPGRCPVVWLVQGDVTTVDDDALDVPTTIVERGSLGAEPEFLVRKIRGMIRTDSPRGADRSTFETLVESASDGLYTLDAAGRVSYLNESFAAMLGYERGELVGTHAGMVMADGELERGQELIQALMADDDRESDVMDMEMRTKRGEPITVSVHFSVLTGPAGSYEGVMGVVRDITERKRRERELARKRERLEEFVAAVSHDLRTPLSVAKGNLELVRREHESEELETAVDALDRMEHLVDDVLELARKGRTVEDPAPVSLGDVVSDARESVPPSATVENDLGAATVRGDYVRLVEVFENLFGNAVEHGDTDATIRVGPLDDGRGFYVADDGPGIPPDRRERVFEHGHTTSDDGTGFGLTIVRRIVEAHGWRISVTESETGGARFETSGVESLGGPDDADTDG